MGDGEVRELIRRRGLDPFTDPVINRVPVRDVVADYSERSLTSALPPIGDAESVVRDVLDRVAGFAPTVAASLFTRVAVLGWSGAEGGHRGQRRPGRDQGAGVRRPQQGRRARSCCGDGRRGS